MKVLHIIPAAFNYFDDIRAQAFRLVDALNQIGVASEAATIQFGPQAPEAPAPTEVFAGAPPLSRTYAGVMSPRELQQSFAGADAVHVHCPLLGAAGTVLAWKRREASQPLVVTYYRAVKTPDFFSLLAVAYNWWYLPRLFAAASAVAAPSFAAVPWRLRRQTERLIEMDDEPEFGNVEIAADDSGREFTPLERLATKYAMVYNDIVTNRI